VLDTSAVILLPRLGDAATLPAEPVITVVTLAELSVGPLVAATEPERAARQAHLQQAEADFDPLPFDATAARASGRVAASLRRAGPKTAARDPTGIAHQAKVTATFQTRLSSSLGTMRRRRLVVLTWYRTVAPPTPVPR
jgi:predicted nucleic acid-binding protein